MCSCRHEQGNQIMKPHMRYLTKSRFKMALQCLTKLYYTSNEEYADQSLDDPFLEALAEGGFQVGELARFLFCDDPICERITIETLNYNEALEETRKRLNGSGRVVIAEGAFEHETLFIRTDLIVKQESRIDLYEVKAKSIDDTSIQFYSKRGAPRIRREWEEYVYDAAFQKYVMTKALNGCGSTISAYLILVDKDKVASVDGLNQKFKVIKGKDGRSRIEVQPGLKKSSLGDSILRIVPVDDAVQKIWEEFPVPTDYAENMKFEDFVNIAADAYRRRNRIYTAIGSKCRNCEFVNAQEGAHQKRSGFHECWKNATRYEDERLHSGLVIELWGGRTGRRSLVQELIDKNIYRLDEIPGENVMAPEAGKKAYEGLRPFERRMEQITRARAKSKESYFDQKGLAKEMARWVYPLHMIDFETTMTALPFHAGRHPYEGIAFQFSHHMMERNGEVYHAGQFLSFEPGKFPNYEFTRELKEQLTRDAGSIFRYHNHENTYLNHIYSQLEADPNPPGDKEDLKAFIREITRMPGDDERHQGHRCMIDLYELVLRYYYSPLANGSNSIKKILTAVIADSKYLRERYSCPIYGKEKQIRSLNFDEHVWIDPKFDNDPYKTLPRLFAEYDGEKLDRMFPGLEDIREGGAAMTAYNYLQFSDIPSDQREELRQGLLRYCELDTLAMIMIIEGWNRFGP